MGAKYAGSSSGPISSDVSESRFFQACFQICPSPDLFREIHKVFPHSIGNSTYARDQSVYYDMATDGAAVRLDGTGFGVTSQTMRSSLYSGAGLGQRPARQSRSPDRHGA
jgi:hypothetical protein